ncbi:hypothetical protein KY285_010008 [Solanum tuberosum]|nr:hypothetical protein KY285_010008 [Solanum tuberosum]
MGGGVFLHDCILEILGLGAIEENMVYIFLGMITCVAIWLDVEATMIKVVGVYIDPGGFGLHVLVGTLSGELAIIGQTPDGSILKGAIWGDPDSLNACFGIFRKLERDVIQVPVSITGEVFD